MNYIARILRAVLSKLGVSGPQASTVDPLDSLVELGLRIGSNTSIQDQVSIDPSHCWLISIGDDVTIAPGVRIIAHDASTKRTLGFTRLAAVNIGNRVFIGAGSIILPGTTIGDDVVVGAGSVVPGLIAPGVVIAGVPAREISTTEKWLEQRRTEMAQVPRFTDEYTIGGGITPALQEEMIASMGSGPGYVP